MITMPADKVSVDAAKPDKLFYFVCTVVPYRTADGKCLLLKRDEREKVHPGKWGVPGGKLEHGDLDLGNPTRLNGDVMIFVIPTSLSIIAPVRTWSLPFWVSGHFF